MNVVEIRDRHDEDGGEGVLALLLLMYIGGVDPQYPIGVKFVTHHDDDLQVAVMRHPAGTSLDPHVHPPRQRTVSTTGEVIAVKSGKVMVNFYNSRQEYVDTRVLGPGDVMIFKAGGHDFQFMEESELLEVKQGPYQPTLDKIKFKLEA